MNMKRTYFLIIALLVQVQLFAQSSNLIFFTEDGEKFILFIDGDQKNDAPLTRVTASGINSDFAQVKVRFEHPGAPVLTQQMMIDPGMQMTSVIRKNKKGRYVMRPVSSVPVASISETETVRIEDATVSEKPAGTSISASSSTVSAGGQAQGGDDQVSVGIGVSDGQNNVNMQVKVEVSGSFKETHSTAPEDPEPVSQESQIVECAAMSTADYTRAKKSISNKAFADEKMTIVRQVLRANCVSVDQVIGFIDLFTFEENKLDVAKAAYVRTTDKGNYYQVNDALTYSESVEELNRFLESQ